MQDFVVSLIMVLFNEVGSMCLTNDQLTSNINLMLRYNVHVWSSPEMAEIYNFAKKKKEIQKIYKFNNFAA